ncbi:MAG: hypothetical protein DDT19_02725 [Syntrophomonadaceae bacterium]|nr:hypothetical protein [Bacillota bacterium]
MRSFDQRVADRCYKPSDSKSLALSVRSWWCEWRVGLRKIVRKVFTLLFDKPLPMATAREVELIDDLRKVFRAIEQQEIGGCTPSESFWRNNMNRLKELVLNDDPREFLRWDVVRETMFVGNASYISKELDYLKKHKEWDVRWRDAIRELPTGRPLPFFKYPSSSGNLIHHAYHLARFEDKTNTRIQDMQQIFEFGGGYGSMCRLAHRLGFKGKYIIFDLPSFSVLQAFYLKCLDLAVRDADSFDGVDNGVFCISDLDALQTMTPVSGDNSLFIATWSLSESPIHVRAKVVPFLQRYGAFLLAYQELFGEVDNVKYFSGLGEDREGIQWSMCQIDHVPKSWYLFGWPKVREGAPCHCCSDQDVV